MKIEDKPQLVIGDVNFCFLNGSSNPTRKYFEENNFLQLVQDPTHIEGNIIDQAHVRDVEGKYEYSMELHSKYYSDHNALALSIRKVIE